MKLPPNHGASHEFHTDELRVGHIDLPDAFPPTRDRADWPSHRQTTLELFADHVYGRTPAEHLPMTVTDNESSSAFDGLATRQQTRLTFTGNCVDQTIDVLMYVPTGSRQPAPAFVVPNFGGNHTITDDPCVQVSLGATRDLGDQIEARNAKGHRFPLETILRRGFALATFYDGDADADLDDGNVHGVQRLFESSPDVNRRPDAWGTIGAWAWGCSRVLDWLELRDEVDARSVVVGGHSRLGKAALWAGAQDERFMGVFSNNSGCGGAALSRRRFGEHIAIMTALFPHWGAPNLAHYAGNEHNLPVDQHQLLGLIAPRGLHVGSASDDAWADPRGEFLATRAAGDVFQFLGCEPLALSSFPEVGNGSVGDVGYHLRSGGHDLTEVDWEFYLAAADHWVHRQTS